MDFAPGRNPRTLSKVAQTYRASTPVRQAVRSVVEALEDRKLLAITLTNGELVVEGSLKKNNGLAVEVSADQATYYVRVNSERQTFDGADVQAIKVVGGRYHDYINIGQNVKIGAMLYPGWGNDTTVGGAGNDQVHELGGGNRIYTNGGDDYIFGGVGDDVVYGGYGDDVFYGNGGIDRFYGEFGDDYFDGGDKKNFAYGGPGSDKSVNSSYKRDVEDYAGLTTSVAAASATYRLNGTILTVTGLQNSSNRFNIAYNSTNTYINVTVGTATQSYKVGSIRQIRILGGAKNDFVQVSSSITLPMLINVGSGNDTVYAGSGDDTINAGDGNDFISSGKGNDLINGENGNDTIYASIGNDSLVGGAGNDRLYGQSGRDLIDGGSGTDYVDGGPDADSQKNSETKVNVEGTLTSDIPGGTPGTSGGGGTTTGGGGTTTGGGGTTTGGGGTTTGGGGTTTGGGGTTTGGGGTTTGGGGTTTGGGGTTTGGGGTSGGGTTSGSGNQSSSGSGGGYTGGGNNGKTSAGGGIIDEVDVDASAPKPIPQVYALQTTINAGQTIFVHGTNSVLKAGDPTTARYEWDFGDPKGTYNNLVGFNAGHTYDEPGTYKLTLRVINEKRGAAEISYNITVLPAGRKVLYISAAGNDANDGTSTSKAVKTWARAAQLVTDQGNVEILFRRGDTFEAKNTLSITKGNVRIGAYGTGSDPTIKWAGAKNGSAMVLIGSGVVGSMVDDLTFDSIWPGPTGDRAGMPTGVKVNGYGNSIRGSTFLNVGYAIQTNGIPTGVLVQDCEAPSPFALRNYLVWGEGSHFVLLGNKVVNSVVEHAVRIGGVDHLLIAYGEYDNPKLYDFEVPKNALNIQRADFVTIFGNKLTSEQQIGPLGGTDGLNSKHFRLTNVVIEANLIEDGYLNVRHGAENIMIRNNVFKLDNDANIIVEAYNSEYGRGVKNLQIINNTAINTGTRGRFLYVGGTVDGIDLVNNLYKADNLLVGSYGTSAVYVNGSNLSSFRTIANNIWPVPEVTKWVADNATGGTAIAILGSYNRIANYYNLDQWNKFSQVLTDYQQDTHVDSTTYAPRSTQGAATFGAKYAGVFTDFNGKDRSLDEAWSVGAIEL